MQPLRVDCHMQWAFRGRNRRDLIGYWKHGNCPRKEAEYWKDRRGKLCGIWARHFAQLLQTSISQTLGSFASTSSPGIRDWRSTSSCRQELIIMIFRFFRKKMFENYESPPESHVSTTAFFEKIELVKIQKEFEIIEPETSTRKATDPHRHCP